MNSKVKTQFLASKMTNLCALLLCRWNVSLWSKVVCLFIFCFVPMRSNELGWFRSRSWSPSKALSRTRGVSAWFHGIWICVVEVLKYWMISPLKIKLNCNRKFWRNWNVPLVLLERSNGQFLSSPIF
jgi:hypothetical protein